MKNYYKILEVGMNATDDEIKRSYRVLAKRYHPDVNPDDAAAAEKFADINEANAVLSDPKARADYDIKLKEASAPKPNRDDIIARQRAQAQAAARQAAVNNIMRDAHDPVSVAAAAARLRAQQAAQAQAQMQSQVNALCNQAFAKGRDQGISEAKQAAEKELAKYNAKYKELAAENEKLKKQLAEERRLKTKLNDTERDRRDLENELFNRDRELAQEKIRAKELEEQLAAARQSAGDSAEVKRLEAENASLKEMLDDAQQRARELEQCGSRSELKNKAQIKLQQDKRKQMQDEIDALNAKVAELESELDAARQENEQWQQYASSQDFLSDAERRIEEWNKKTQADKRKAKQTLYGVLGVLMWAKTDEIEAAFNKLEKRYSGKSGEDAAAKLKKVREAYLVLSDEEKRREYNASIDVTDEQIEHERELIAEYETMQEEYRNRLATKEFWEYYDELNAAALEGDADSQNALGEMFYYGDEIDQDFEQAVFWFKEAAKQKHADAMYNLGVCFVNGEGTEKNENTGLGFIRQAAKLGSEAAKKYGA